MCCWILKQEQHFRALFNWDNLGCHSNVDDHTLSETLFLALTDLSCATQMWHVLVGTQVWSKQKAYFFTVINIL